MEYSMEDLPLGSLESALADFTTDAVPLLSPEEAVDLHKELDHFLANEGPALEAKLQAKLNDIHAEQNHKNWMHNFWIDGYLSERAPIQTALNYSVHIDCPFNKKDTDPLQNLSNWMLKVALTYAKIKKKKPRFFQKGTRKFCLEQALPFFEQIRHPKIEVDQYKIHQGPLENIALHYHGKIFICKVLDKKCHFVDPQSLKSSLQLIFAGDHSHGEANDFSYIADKGSDVASQFLETWLTEGQNEELFKTLTSCICHIHISDHPYNEGADLAKSALMNNQGHLWAYIPLNFIFWVNSEISLLAEHSLIDATTLGYIITEIKSCEIDKKRLKKYPTHLEEINFLYHEECHEQLASLKKRTQIKPENFSIEGLTLTFSHHHYSIDALTQLMFQYAQYQIDGCLRSIYAPCAMNHFHMGRTETIRSISGASKAFIKAFSEDLFDKDLFSDSLEEYRLHIKRTKLGKGYQRHLSLLKQLANIESIESAFFESKAWHKLSENFFSTSNAGELGNPFNQFYFTPPQGAIMGIGYFIKENTLRVCSITHKKDTDYLREANHHFEQFVKLINPQIESLYLSTHSNT